jgi:hypothetical protein
VRGLPLVVLGFVPATFLARLVPLYEGGVGAYWCFLVVVACGLGGLYALAGRRNELDALLAAMLTPVVLLAVDVVRGSQLIFNSPLGYSPTVGGRYTGLGNLAYAAFASAALLGAVLLRHRLRGGWRTVVPIALLMGAIALDGAPWWGSDVGGILSMVPAYAVATIVMVGVRVRWRSVLWCVAGLVVTLTAFTLLDLARPQGQRTHLGRLVERVQDEGFGGFARVVGNKLANNLGTISSSYLGLVVLVAVLFFWWMARRAPGRAESVFTWVPEWRAGCAGIAVLAVLGYAFNDSGITIPGIMLYVFVSAWVWLGSRAPEPPPVRLEPQVQQTAGAPELVGVGARSA